MAIICNQIFLLEEETVGEQARPRSQEHFLKSASSQDALATGKMEVKQILGEGFEEFDPVVC